MTLGTGKGNAALLLVCVELVNSLVPSVTVCWHSNIGKDSYLNANTQLGRGTLPCLLYVLKRPVSLVSKCSHAEMTAAVVRYITR